MDGTAENQRTTDAPKGAQLSPRKLLAMSVASLRHHLAASMLQICTIAATAAFLTFVLGEMIVIRASRDLPTAVANAQGRLAHLAWILIISLLVCTISNTTSMLLSVRKRFREIGTMKCLGAFDGSILVLFLVEATLLGGAGALVGAVHALGVSRVGFSSPYLGEINTQAMDFLTQNRITTVKCADIGRELGNYGQGELTPDEVFDLAMQADHPKAEAIILSCTDMRAVEAIDRIETALDKPVVTSNQAMMFALMRALDLPRHRNVPGRVFDLL